MRNRTILLILIKVALLLSSCDDEDEKPIAPDTFSISAKIGNDAAEYNQTVFDGGVNGNINVFNRTDKTLYLQAFKNGTDDTDGFWTIRINDLDIETLTLPYTLTGIEGSVTWTDESIKVLQAPCAQPDVLCFYAGAGVDEVTITITEVANNTISGEFNGKLNHIQVNPTVTRDTKDFTEIVEGKFRMQYQISN
ncbi:MAG: hypothetical protein AAGI07_06510 [Bacteroidota bacterium]